MKTKSIQSRCVASLPAFAGFRTTRPARTVAALLSLLVVGAALSSAAMAAITFSMDSGNLTPTAGGAAFDYHIMVKTDAVAYTDLVITDQLPSDVLFQSVTPTCVGPATGTNGAVICSVKVVPANTTMHFTIIATIAPNTASGIRTNFASYSTSAGAGSLVAVQQIIQNDATLTIENSALPTGIPGENIVYNITVNNAGASSAINVAVTDVLPPKVSFVSMFATGPFHDGCLFDPVAGALICRALYLPRGPHDITLVVKTAPTVTGSLSNTASVTAGAGVVAVGFSTATTSYPAGPSRP